MSRPVRLLSYAVADVQQILDWLRQRAPRGADAWYDALQVRLERLGEDSRTSQARIKSRAVRSESASQRPRSAMRRCRV